MLQGKNTISEDTGAKLLATFAIFVLVFSVSRGLVPILTGSADLARPTYTLSFIAGLLLSLPGVYYAAFEKNGLIPRQLSVLLLTGLFLHILWFLPFFKFKTSSDFIISFAYTGIFPFAVFGLARIPEKHLKISLAAVTLLVAGAVIWEFIELNSGIVPGGFESAVARQRLMRPGGFQTFGNTALLLRPVGLTGPLPHESGNLLAILSIYWIATLLRDGAKKLPAALLALLAVMGMMLGQSAADIVAFFAGILVLAALKGRQVFGSTRGLKLVLGVLATTLGLLSLTSFFGVKTAVLWQWTKRLAPSSAWGDMVNLGITEPGLDLLTAVTGHGSSLGLSQVGDISEISFVKLLMELGLPCYLVLMSILLYPAWRYLSAKSATREKVLPYLVAALVGVISLWHYGSILKTTNEFVFLALYAHTLRIYAGEATDKVLLSANKKGTLKSPPSSSPHFPNEEPGSRGKSVRFFP